MEPTKFYRGGYITQKYGSRTGTDEGWGSAPDGSRWDAVQAETPLYLRRLGGKKVRDLKFLKRIRNTVWILLFLR